jgi:gliding motility-associated-like protein
MMKKIICFLVLLCSCVNTVSAQADCEDAQYICNENGFSFVVNSNGDGAVNDLCTYCTTNPGTNPGPSGNSGCLLSGENDPTWLIISVAQSGQLEFTLGNGGGGFYDWALWAYEDNGTTTTCDFLHTNSQPPVACNWNSSSSGFTGMYQQGSLPPGGNQGNFEFALNVTAGDQFILCFSNWSGQVGVTVPVNFGNNIPGNNNPNTAAVTCEPSTPDQSICLGSSATVNVASVGMVNPSFNWLVTDGVSNPTSGTNVIVTPTQTTQYIVEITEGNVVLLDTFLITVVAPPTPNAGPDAIICFGQPIPLDGTRSFPNSTVAWTAITTGITPNPSVNYQPNAAAIDPNVTVNQPGIYRFVLSENNGVCPAVRDTVQVLVSRNTHATTWTGPSCAGMTNGTITINNPNAVDYSFNNGQTWVTNPTQAGFGVGTYLVFSRNQYGCTYSSNVTITEPAQLHTYASEDTLICQNGSVELTAFTSAANTYMIYHWSHTTDNAATVNIGPFTSNQTITVYAEGPGGCLSDTAEVIVSVRPPLSGEISEFDTICPGYPTTIGVAALEGGFGTPYTISWNSGEEGMGDFMNIQVNPPQTQIYTATISDACETTPLILTTQVYVAPVPVPEMSVVEPVICEPAVFEVHLETDSVMAANYVWYFPQSQSAINEPVIYTDTLMEGLYDVQLIVTSPLGCIDSVTMTNFLTVLAKPTANFSWSPNPVLMFNTDVYFQNMSFLANEYEWSFPGAVPPYSNLERPKVTYPIGETGTYPVTLIVTSEFGCTDTVTKPLIVYPEVTLYAPNAFTPDGDEFNQKWGVQINGVDMHSFHLQVFNRWGMLIYESHDSQVGWDGTYNGELVPSGTYTWTISARDFHNDGKYNWNGFVNVLK